MIGETITVVVPGATIDGHGNTVPDWDDTDETDVANCAFAPTQTPEDRAAGRQGVVITGTVYMPPGVPVPASARLVIRGQTYEVDGPSGEWNSPYRAVDIGLEVSVRRVEG